MNRRLLSSIALVAFSFLQVSAQLSEGGTPLSMHPNYSQQLAGQYIPKYELTKPDIEALKRADASAESVTRRQFRIGALTNADISFPEAGTFTTLDDGRQVWRTQVSIPNALAMGLYYDRFHLPEGVKMYLMNENRKQVLGAYTSYINPEDGIWANEKVEGEVTTIELDIEADAKVDDIQMHIEAVADFYQSVSYLARYSPERKTAALFPFNGSSSCEINAICPIGSGFPAQRKATVHIEYRSSGSVFAGSGTMMNNTRQDCTPYMLTASHIEGSNSTSNSTFSNWVIYFNYETPTCTYTSSTPPPSIQTLTGGTLKARSSYNKNSDAIVGDFLLLQLRQKVPVAYQSFLVGWNLSATAASGQHTSFHHPAGDVKKVSITNAISSRGDFNGGQANSHWQVNWTQGGIEEGSSGSGLFDPNGRLIGDLSGGSVIRQKCLDTNVAGEQMSDFAVYSKINLNWSYTYQQPSSAATRLKDWLDPTNSGVMTLDVLSGDCALSVKEIAKNNTEISIYPNPAKDRIYINFSNEMDNANIVLLDVVGHVVPTTYEINKDNYILNTSNIKPGIYMVRVNAGDKLLTKKIMIAK